MTSPGSVSRPLGFLADYLNGRAFRPDEWGSEGLPIIRIQNLTDASALFNYYSGPIDERHRVRDGDLLVSWSASLDAFLWNRGEAVLNQHIFKVIERRDVVDREYLFFALREAMSEIRAQVHGATMRHITKPEFEAVEVPVPPVAEQRRIAARLKEQLAAVERVRRATEERVEAARRLARAELLEFGRRFAGVPTRVLGDVVVFGPAVSVVNGGDATVPYVTTGCLTELGFRKEAVRVATMARDSIERATLSSGEVLVARSNTPDLVGRVAVYDGSVPGAVAGDLTIRLRPREGCESPYLAAWLSWLYVSGFWKDRAGGASGTMKKITRTQLSQLNVPIPPKGEQQRLVSLLASRLRQVHVVLETCDAALAAIEALPATLLREAFSGAG